TRPRTLSLHDALPICHRRTRRNIERREPWLVNRMEVRRVRNQRERWVVVVLEADGARHVHRAASLLDSFRRELPDVDGVARKRRSEEHTSELQSLRHL